MPPETKTQVTLNEEVRRLTAAVDRLVLVIDGDPSRDVKGMRPRLESLERTAEEYRIIKSAVRWLLIGMGVTGITNLTAAVALIIKTVTGGP